MAPTAVECLPSVGEGLKDTLGRYAASEQQKHKLKPGMLFT